MRLKLTKEALRALFPKAPEAIIDAFIAKQAVLDAAGITLTRDRLAIALAQVKHETAGFTIPNLTENINYSATRACAVWPSRFRNAADCYKKVGSFAGDPDFPHKLLDQVYGNRMGNRPGTDDGSKFIGRGGPQVTGRDGYREVGKRSGLPLEDLPNLACQAGYQPEILAAFWTWKGLNAATEKGGLKGVTKLWNGGYIGMESREAAYEQAVKIVAGLEFVAYAEPEVQVTTKGNPAPAVPPPAVEVPAKEPLTMWERFKALFA